MGKTRAKGMGSIGRLMGSRKGCEDEIGRMIEANSSRREGEFSGGLERGIARMAMSTGNSTACVSAMQPDAAVGELKRDPDEVNSSAWDWLGEVGRGRAKS